MNKHNHYVLTLLGFISYFSFMLTSQAKELIVPVNDLQDIIKVDVIDTPQARPTQIQINKYKDSLQVTGFIKRKGHKKQRIRGHVDVDLFSANGELIESRLFKFKSFIGPAKHDHQRKFTAMFSLPKSDNYRVAIRHHMYMDGHE